MSFLYEDWDLSINEDRLEFAESYVYEVTHDQDPRLVPIQAGDFEPIVKQSAADKMTFTAVSFLIFCATNEEAVLRKFAVDLSIEAFRPHSPRLAAVVCHEALLDTDDSVSSHTRNRIYTLTGGNREGMLEGEIDPQKLLEVMKANKVNSTEAVRDGRRLQPALT